MSARRSSVFSGIAPFKKIAEDPAGTEPPAFARRDNPGSQSIFSKKPKYSSMIFSSVF